MGFRAWLAANQANQRFLNAKEVRTLGNVASSYHINARYIFSSVITTSQDDAYMFNTNDTALFESTLTIGVKMLASASDTLTEPNETTPVLLTTLI